MLEGEKQLTLSLLNEATQAWLELEYHRALHRELGQTPLEVLMNAPNVVRPAPTARELRRAFRTQETRTQRRSDGTISVEGVRFEIPWRYRALERPTVRIARWDLSSIELARCAYRYAARHALSGRQTHQCRPPPPGVRPWCHRGANRAVRCQTGYRAAPSNAHGRVCGHRLAPCLSAPSEPTRCFTR